MGRMLASDAMGRAHLTFCAICLLFTASCGNRSPRSTGSGDDRGEPLSSSALSGSATSNPPTSFHAQKFRDPALPGPAYLATSDQLLVIDADGSTDIIGDNLAIAQIEPLATGDLLVRSASGLSRVNGRVLTSITASVPAAALELAAAADDDVWAVGKRAVHHFDGKDWVATAVPGSNGESSLHDVAIDARGVAWLAAGADGLFEWDGNRWKKHGAVKGEVLDVAASATGVFALLPSGIVEVQGGTVRSLVERHGSDVERGDIAVDGSWTMLFDDGSGRRSFAVGKGAAQAWADSVIRLGSESIWFVADTRARVWVARKRSVTVLGKEPPDTWIPLHAAVVGDLIAVEIIGAGPDKLPVEIGPSVSLPSPTDPPSKDGEPELAMPSGSARRGNVVINAEPGFADGVVSNASLVVAGMTAGFRRCYNRGLLENPNMKGSLRITTKIGPNGEVLSATPSTGSSLSQSVVSCLASRVASANFAKPNGGSATIVIPVSLLPQP